jgi:hypothetical protein
VKSDYPSPLARLVAEIKRDRPDVYRELRCRRVESISRSNTVRSGASTTTGRQSGKPGAVKSVPHAYQS